MKRIYAIKYYDIGMNVIETLVAILTSLGGWELVKYLINRKSNARISEAEADSAEFHVMKEQIEFMQEQMKQKEERFAEQTTLVRNLNNELLEITKKLGSTELELQKYRCIRPKCLEREPQNGY